jgi:hypothetical protein
VIQTADMTVRRRNAAIKKLLKHRFGDVPISVRGAGVSNQFIECEIETVVPLRQHNSVRKELLRSIESAGIELPYFGSVLLLHFIWDIDKPGQRFNGTIITEDDLDA